MDKPTPEQIKALLEWCGFDGNKLQYLDGIYHYRKEETLWLGLPLDFDCLFEYAIPKLHAWTMGSCPDGDTCAITIIKKADGKVIKGEACTKDPILALFWALYQAMEA